MATPFVKAAFLFSESFKEPMPQGGFTHIYLCIDLSSGYEEINSSTRSDQITAFARTARQSYTGVKFLLSIGGDSSIFGEGRLIHLLINLLKKLPLDGLDLRWLYPATHQEMITFGGLLAEMRKALPPSQLLTATVFYSPRYLPHVEYPIQAIVENCDWINVIAFDLYTPDSSPKLTAPPAPLYNKRNAVLSGDHGVTAWIDAGVPPKKLVFGLPFYGHSWSLVNLANNGLFSPAEGAATEVSDPIPYSRILNFIKQTRATPKFDPSYVTHYCSAGKTWIGYDGMLSIPIKVRYAKKTKGLLGYFAWHVEDDTADWTLSKEASIAWDNIARE